MVEKGPSKQGLLKRTVRTSGDDADVMGRLSHILSRPKTFSRAGRMTQSLGSMDTESSYHGSVVPFHVDDTTDAEFSRMTRRTRRGTASAAAAAVPGTRGSCISDEGEIPDSDINNREEEEEEQVRNRSSAEGAQFMISRKDPKTVICSDGERIPLEKTRSFWRQRHVGRYFGERMGRRWYITSREQEEEMQEAKKRTTITADDLAAMGSEGELLEGGKKKRREGRDATVETEKRSLSSSFKSVSRDVLSSSMRARTNTDDTPDVGYYRPRFTLVEKRSSADYAYRQTPAPLPKTSFEQGPISRPRSSEKNHEGGECGGNDDSLSRGDAGSEKGSLQDTLRTKKRKIKHKSYGVLDNGRIDSSLRFREWRDRHSLSEDRPELMAAFLSMSRDKRAALSSHSRLNLEPGQYWPAADKNLLSTRNTALYDMDRRVSREDDIAGNMAPRHTKDIIYDVKRGSVQEDIGKGKHSFDQFCGRVVHRMSTRIGIAMSHVDAENSDKVRNAVFNRFYDVNTAPIDPRSRNITPIHKHLPRDVSRKSMHPKFYENSGLVSYSPNDTRELIKKGAVSIKDTLLGGSEMSASGWVHRHLMSTQRRPAFLVNMKRQTSRRRLYDARNVDPNLEYDTTVYEAFKYPRERLVRLDLQTGRTLAQKDAQDGPPPGAYHIREDLIKERIPQVHIGRTPGRKG